MNEADTCRTYVLPKLKSAGWEDEAISEQMMLTPGRIENLNVPLPPLEEQRRLVAYLDGLQAQVSALRAVQAETERELSALMPSVLDRAFKGEL